MWKRLRSAIVGEGGFTLIEAMMGITLLTFGLLAVADVFPRGLGLALYGKDQTRATSLAQQELEYVKSQTTSWIAGKVGDYASAGTVSTAYFDQNGGSTTQTSPQMYFTRDVQIQYWLWTPGGCSGPSDCFVISGTPYTAPSSGAYVFRVSVATHWLVKGQTAFVSGQTANGCVSGSTAVPTGVGCVQVSTFISP